MIEWSQLTSDELQAVDRELPVIVPLGLIEAHGPHMTVEFDVYSGEYFARKVAEATGVILAPVLAYGFADAMREYPGTLGLKPQTMAAVIGDIGEHLCAQGFKKVIFLSGHGGNKLPCEMGFHQVWEKYPDFQAAYWNWWTEAGLTNIHHADADETSIALAIDASVHLDRARDYVLSKPWYAEYSRFRQNPVSGGVNGEPTKANYQEGVQMRDHVVQILSHKVEQILHDDVD